jgi:hypothetical protein
MLNHLFESFKNLISIFAEKFIYFYSEAHINDIKSTFLYNKITIKKLKNGKKNG